jgi:hypothetical protein
MVKLYGLASGALDWSADDPRVVEVADILERLMIRAAEAGKLSADGIDDHLHLQRSKKSTEDMLNPESDPTRKH